MTEVHFDLAIPGYHRAQVRRYVDDLARRLFAALAGLDAAATLQSELVEAQAEIMRLRAIGRYLPGPQQTGEQIERIFVLVEAQAAALRLDAERDAALVRAAAERDAQMIRERALAEAARARRDFEAVLRSRHESDQRCEEVLREIVARHRDGPRRAAAR